MLACERSFTYTNYIERIDSEEVLKINLLINIMSKNQYINSLELQIKALNERIDAKIVKGMAYREESRRHKMLLQKLREQQKHGLGRFIPIFA